MVLPTNRQRYRLNNLALDSTSAPLPENLRDVVCTADHDCCLEPGTIRLQDTLKIPGCRLIHLDETGADMLDGAHASGMAFVHSTDLRIARAFWQWKLIGGFTDVFRVHFNHTLIGLFFLHVHIGVSLLCVALSCSSASPGAFRRYGQILELIFVLAMLAERGVGDEPQRS